MMLLRSLFLALVFWCASLAGASSHALEPGYLDLRQLADETWQVFWRKPDVRGKPMQIDAVLPDQCSPARGAAPAHDGSAWVTSWAVHCSGGLAGGRIQITGLDQQNTDVLVRIEPLGGNVQTMRLTPDRTSGLVPETPDTLSVFTSYAVLGFEHILEGWDHLLFVFALLLLIRDRWRLVGAITAFTVAHSITLALAALGHVRVPGPPVEAVIALSIVFLAVEILKQRGGQARLSERYPWIVSFSFGLLHGLGFAGALAEIGLPDGDIPAALLAFNLGVEAGQLFFVTVVLGVFWVLGRAVPWLLASFRGSAMPLTGYAIGAVATFWLVERVSGF